LNSEDNDGPLIEDTPHQPQVIIQKIQSNWQYHKTFKISLAFCYSG